MLLRALLLAGALAACADSSVRHDPALPQSTPAFPATWDRTQVVGSSRAAAEPAPERRSLQSQHAQLPQGPIVAVLEFRNRLPEAEKALLDGSYVSNAVRAAVKRTLPEARLMTQENIQVLLQTHGKTLADCQGECEVETGRLLGADIIVTGDLLRVGTKLKLDLRMHETKTGQLIAGSLASGASVDELDTDLPRAVKELVLGLR